MSPLTAARLMLGIVGLVAPRHLYRLYSTAAPSPRTVTVARVLAARHVVQAIVVTLRPTRRTRMGSGAVDASHALTMVALALASPRFRRPAATSAAVAVSLAVATVVSLRRSHRTTGNPPHESASKPRAVSGTSPKSGDARVQLDDVAGMERIAHRNAAALTRRTEQLLAATQEAPMRSWSRAGAALLMLLAVWLMVGPWVLSLPMTAAADSTTTRDGGFAVIIAVAALRLLVARRSPVGTCAALVCGVLLVVAGLVLGHSTTRGADNEVICGVAALLGAVATLDWRRSGALARQPLPTLDGST